MKKEEHREQLMQQVKEKSGGDINFTADEVCEILKISRASLSRLQKASKIGFWKDGESKNSTIRFTINHVVDYMIKQEIIPYVGF